MKRKWIDLLLFYATVMIIVSGIVLYIMPHGRVAYFTGWKFLGIDKDGWDNLHVIFGFLMVIVAIWHMLINWKVMKKYLMQKESIFALLITAIISIGTLTNIQPFKSVSDLEDMIKNSWEVSKVDIPLAHAELLTLKELCQKLNIPYQSAAKILENKKIIFNAQDTLKEIAKKNNTTPNKIYELIKNANSPYIGTGLGMMSLSEVCQKEGIDLKVCLNRLKKEGINAKKDDTLRELAFSHNLRPIDILNIIKGE